MLLSILLKRYRTTSSSANDDDDAKNITNCVQSGAIQ
jgi:hypothetical protein